MKNEKGAAITYNPFNEQKQETRKTNIMEIIDFAEKIKGAFNPYSSLVGQQVKSMMKDNCGVKEIEVQSDVFEDIIKATGIVPTVATVYRFIRIQDNNGNSVDIQTRK